MQVRRLSLTNFRNYSRLELDLPPGAILLHGDNAQGKTNLLEALYLLATTRSPHASQDYQMVNQAALAAEEPVVVGRLVAEVDRPDEPVQLEMRLIIENRDGRNTGTPTLRREALINRRKVRLMDLLGQLRVVLFLPEDVELVTGSPAARRRYINITLCQVDPDYCRHLSVYNKVLEQRNALLRRMAEGKIAARNGADLLPILTQKLVVPGGHLLARRAVFVNALGRETHRIYYEDLIKQRETIRLSYLPRWRSNGRDSLDEQRADGDWLEQKATDPAVAAERLAQALAESEAADLGRGSTSVGPHRDDWMLLVNGRNLGDYGSRGQLRTAVLALKLAEINWMKAMTSDVPLLLLDEVIAELDLHRREALLNYVQDAVQDGATGQALLTATDPGMFLSSFLATTTSMLVSEGRVTRDTAEPGGA
jgi:DNA replication and repair protein RecF